MGTPLRIVMGLLALWLLVVGGLALWPESAGTQPFRLLTPSGLAPQAGQFAHTGRWVIEVGADGEAAYLREIARY